MGDGIAISQSEIDALLGFANGPSTVDTPIHTSAPPTVESRPQSQATINSSRAEPHSLGNLSDSKNSGSKQEIDLIKDVPLELSVELGRARKSIADILDFGLGTVVELNRLAGEPVDLLANGKLIAKGEVVVIDENFALRVTEIISPKK